MYVRTYALRSSTARKYVRAYMGQYSVVRTYVRTENLANGDVASAFVSPVMGLWLRYLRIQKI